MLCWFAPSSEGLVNSVDERDLSLKGHCVAPTPPRSSDHCDSAQNPIRHGFRPLKFSRKYEPLTQGNDLNPNHDGNTGHPSRCAL